MNTKRPFWWSLLPDRWVRVLATCGPVGYWGKAPGTNGTVVGLLLYTAVFHLMPLWGQVVGLAVLSYVAVVVCGEGELRLQKRDPGEIILDEIVAVPLCFLGLNLVLIPTAPFWPWALAGFVLFRLFDITKPFGISRLQDLPHGWGVVVDDLAAAAVVCVILHLAAFFVL